MFENYGFQMQALTILMQIKGYFLCNFKISDCRKIGRIISDSCPFFARLNFKIFPTYCAKRVVFADEKFNPKLVCSHLFLVDIGHNSDNKIANFFSLLISKPRFDHENLSNLLNLSAHLITNSSVFLAKGNFWHSTFFVVWSRKLCSIVIKTRSRLPAEYNHSWNESS